MKKQVWHSGPPPSIGWWPTNSDWIRWWDGKTWSYGAREGSAMSTVIFAAKMKMPVEHHIYTNWQERPESWPERSKT